MTHLSVQSPEVFKAAVAARAGASLIGFEQGAAVDGYAKRTAQAKMRDFKSIMDFGAHGNGTTLDDDAMLAAAASGRPIFFPAGREFKISTAIQMARYTGFYGEPSAFAQGGVNPPRIVTDNGSTILTDSNNYIDGLMLTGGNATGEAIKLGRDDEFRGQNVVQNCTIEGYGTAIRLSNIFSVQIHRNYMRSNGRGIDINPIENAGDSGYTTTVSIDHCYITDCTNQGIRDLATRQSKNFSLTHSVVERCAQTGQAMIDLTKQQISLIQNLYIETGSQYTPTPNGIRLQKCNIQNAYFNGLVVGIDGYDAAFLQLENIQFASSKTAGKKNVRVTGGANSSIIMRQCTFDAAPDISARYAVYDHCNGIMPTGIRADAYVMAGTSPFLQLGAAGDPIRLVKKHSHTDSLTVPAGGSAQGLVQLIGSSALAESSLSTMLTSELPDGIIAQAFKVDNDRYRMKYFNITATPLVITASWLTSILRHE